MKKMNSYLYEGLKKIDNLIVLEHEELEDSCLVSFSYNDLVFTFLDKSDKEKEFNIFVITTELEFDAPKKKQLERFMKEFKKFFKNKIQDTAGVNAEYRIESDSVSIRIFSMIPYIDKLDNFENIAKPIVDIIYHLHLEIYLFFLNNFNEELE